MIRQVRQDWPTLGSFMAVLKEAIHIHRANHVKQKVPARSPNEGDKVKGWTAAAEQQVDMRPSAAHNIRLRPGSWSSQRIWSLIEKGSTILCTVCKSELFGHGPAKSKLLRAFQSRRDMSSRLCKPPSLRRARFAEASLLVESASTSMPGRHGTHHGQLARDLMLCG